MSKRSLILMAFGAMLAASVLLLSSDPDSKISPSKPSVVPDMYTPVPVDRGACLPFENFMHINGCPMTLV